MLGITASPRHGRVLQQAQAFGRHMVHLLGAGQTCMTRATCICMQELFNADRFAIGDLAELYYAAPVGHLYLLSQV